MQAALRSRIERLEKELRFRLWVRQQRIFSALSTDELDCLAATGKFPDRPEPLPGTCHLDAMNREQLLALWHEDEKRWFGRSREEIEYFAIHEHWPDQGCGPGCTQ